MTSKSRSPLGAVRSAAVLVGLAFLVAMPSAPGVHAGANPIEPALELERQGAAFTTATEALGSLGTYLDRESGELVAVMPPGVALRQGSLSDVGTLRYRSENASFDRSAIAEVEEALRSVKSDAAFGFYFSAELRRVVVDVAGSKTPFAGIESRFPDLVLVREGDGGTQGYGNDTSPFEGATVIRGPDPDGSGTSTCTSGFAVKNASGTRYLVTAGHCFLNGVTVTTPYPATVGTTLWRLRNSGSDVILIGGKTYNGYIYEPPYQTTRRVSGASDPTYTGSYCVGDALGGTNCGETVASLYATFCHVQPSSDCQYPVVSYTGPVTLSGSSGAPFYLKLTTSASIRGHHLGRISGTMYAQKWSTTSAILGVSIYVP